MLWIAVPELVLRGAQISALVGQGGTSRVGVQFGWHAPAPSNVAAISSWATGSFASSAQPRWHPNYGINSCPAEQDPKLVNGPALGVRTIDHLPVRPVQPKGFH